LYTLRTKKFSIFGGVLSAGIVGETIYSPGTTALTPQCVTIVRESQDGVNNNSLQYSILRTAGPRQTFNLHQPSIIKHYNEILAFPSRAWAFSLAISGSFCNRICTGNSQGISWREITT
jgi:hypothetical protein